MHEITLDRSERSQAFFQYKLSSVEQEAPYAIKYLIKRILDDSIHLNQFEITASEEILKRYNFLNKNGKLNNAVIKVVTPILERFNQLAL